MSYVVIDSIILILQFNVIITNGFILFMFFRVKQLYRNPTLRLMLFVAITDFLHSVTTLPYTIYLFIHCISTPINMNPYYIMISSTPLTIQLKIKLTLTTAIALQRTLALVAPVFYRKLSATLYETGALLLGIIFACIDLLLEFALSPIKESPNCGTIGCFVSDRFLYYWGTSNMFLGLFVIVFTFIVLSKLRSLETKSKTASILVEKQPRKFKQANRTSLGILLTSLFFITIPSVGVGFLEMIGISIFRKVGPFYTVGLLCAASCNGIVYVVLNSDMRKMARGMLSNQQSSSTLFVSTTNKPTPSTLRTQQH